MSDNTRTTSTHRPRRTAPESALKKARLAKGLSQLDLAVASGVSVSWISALERQPGLLTQEIAERLAGALELPLGSLWR